MGNDVIVEIRGKLVKLHGNTPIKVLSEEEAKEAKRQASPIYKAKRFSNMELLDAYLNSLMHSDADAAAIYKIEILFRMNNK